MGNKGCVQQRTVTWAVSLCIAAALSPVIFGALQFRSTGIRGWQALLPAAVVALTMLLGLVWQHRVRGVRRWKAILDAYAEREIARDRRREILPVAVEADSRHSASLETLK